MLENIQSKINLVQLKSCCHVIYQIHEIFQFQKHIAYVFNLYFLLKLINNNTKEI